MRGTNTGSGLDGTPPTGRPVTLRGATFLQVEGDRLMLSRTDLPFLAHLGFNETETHVRRSILSRF